MENGRVRGERKEASRRKRGSRIKGIRSNLKGLGMIYNPFGVQYAHQSALWSWIVFDLPHGSSHLLFGEAGRTKGQSNIISSLVEPQALPVVLFSFYCYCG